MPRGFDRELEQRWRDRFEEFSRSGMKVGEFCRRIGVLEHAFFHWRRELAKRDGQSTSDQLPKLSRRQRKSRRHSAVVPPFVPVEVVQP